MNQSKLIIFGGVNQEGEAYEDIYSLDINYSEKPKDSE